MKQKYEEHLSNIHDWHTCPAVEQIPEKVSGVWVFQGTRVPVRALFENLRDGASIKDFLSLFPCVQHEQVKASIEHEIDSFYRKEQPL